MLKLFFSQLIAYTTALSLAITLLTFTCTLIPFAYAGNLEQNFHSWSSIKFYGHLKQNSKIKYSLQLEIRIRTKYHAESLFNQSLITPAIGYQLTPTLSVWTGYIAIPSISSSTNKLNFENRLWQQINWRPFSNDHFLISTRTRLEERNKTSEPQWANRLREKMIFIFPRALQNLLGHKIGVITTDEIFINLNKPSWVSSRTLAQNRFFIGLEMPTHYHSLIQIGYLNQLLLNSSSNEMRHILYLAITIPT